MKPSFTQRTLIPELMDDLEMSGEGLSETLDQLSLINRWLGGYAILKDSMDYFIQKYSLKDQKIPLTIADIGCGGGDALRELAKYFRKKGIPVTFIGFDANPNIISYARKHSEDYPEIQYEVKDMFSEGLFSRSFDLVLFNLILHHFDDQVIEEYLPRVCDEIRFGVVINDLQRHWLPYRLFQLITWIFRANHMTRNDGLISVRKGFTSKEWKHIVENAVPYSYHIQWKWAFRHQLLINTYE